MKQIAKIFAAAMMVCAAASCSKEGAELFEGSWSFKTSGTVSLVPVGPDGTPLAEAVTLPLKSESGQMTVVGTGDDEMILTMNIIAGDVYVFDAEAHEDEFVLEAEPKVVGVTVSADETVYAAVQASGEGERYGDMIIIEWDYTGGSVMDGLTYVITDSRVETVAKLND